MSKKEKKRGLGKTVGIVVFAIILLSAIGTALGGSDEEDLTITYEIVAGTVGEFGKEIVYNEGTDSEERFYAYYVPVGSYVAENAGDYTAQINVYSDEIKTTEDGWEEPAETYSVELVDAGETADITIKEGYHIEVTEPTHLYLTAK